MIRAEPYPQPLRLDTTPHPAPVTDSTWADARASLESWYRRETATTEHSGQRSSPGRGFVHPFGALRRADAMD